MKVKKLLLLLAILVPGSIFAQNLTVTGTVTEQSSGLPAMGASVVVVGTTNGTVTDLDGVYTLTNVPADAVLSVASIGFATQEIAVAGRKVINVVLEDDNELLNEVVVVGYGTAKSKDLTGAITTVKSDALATTPVSSPMGALQGKMPGVQVVNSGDPGSTPTVRIRGIGAFDSGNQGPLYVVDGMFLDNIDFLDNNNIESLTVLKDASAAAIYGVRAANGVVLITTRTGIKGQSHVTYDGYVGVQTPSHLLKMANTAQYAALMKEAGNTAILDGSIAAWGGSNGIPSTDTNWQKEILSNAFIHSHSVNVNGTGEKGSYLVGGSYYSQDGIVKVPSGYQRFNILAKGDYNPFEWLKIGANTTVSRGDRTAVNRAGFWGAFLMPSVVPVYDKNNAEAFPEKFASPQLAGLNNGYYANPVARMTYFDSKVNSLHVLPSAYAEVSFIPNKLKYRIAVAQDYLLSKTDTFTPSFWVSGISNADKNTLTKRDDFYYSTILDNTLTYTDQFGLHNITAMLGQSSRWENYRWTSSTVNSIPGEDRYLHYVSLGDATTLKTTDGGYSYRGLSFFARASYNYADRYLVSATFRMDGSSKYQQKWGYFPSIGLGWVLSNEEFMKNQKVFDYLKLRASWGMLGNDKVPAVTGTTGIERGKHAWMGDTNYDGYYLQNTFSWLKWEVVKEFNVGASFSTLGNRLNGEIDYYNRLTDNAVVQNTIPVTGETVLANSGKIRNSGIEVSLNWEDSVGDFKYSVGVNGATLKNRVVSIQSGKDNFLTGTAEYQQIMVVGQPMNTYYGYKTNGVYASDAEAAADPIGAALGAKAGYLRIVDMDGDKKLTGADRTYLGAPYPKFTYGGNINLSWKNFDFGMNFYGVTGVDVINVKLLNRYWATEMNFTDAFARDHWTSSNTGSKNPSVAGLLAASNGQLNDYFVQDASYFQIQNIQLGYTFKKIFGLLDTRVYFNAAQPFTFFKYEGFTPELANGIDNETYPMASTFSFGVKITY